MKKLLKLTATLLTSLIIAIGLTGCKKKENSLNTIEQIKKNDVIRIGVFGDKPPFGYIDNQGHHQGFDIEIAKYLAQDLLGSSDKIQFITVEAANRVEYLQSDKVDIILANFTQTPARAEVVDFAQPYMNVALGVVSREGNTINNVDELKDKTLIVNRGTTADIFFTRNYPEIKLLKFEQNTEAFDALRDNRGDALAHDNMLLFAWAKENPGFTVGIKTLGDLDFIAPAVKKGNEVLLNWLNEDLKVIAKDGRLIKAYEKTLQPVYGDSVDVNELLVLE